VTRLGECSPIGGMFTFIVFSNHRSRHSFGLLLFNGLGQALNFTKRGWTTF
jgi:hypothetical protein